MEVLSEIIECSVCLERMDTKSRVLPCQHTFCNDCLERIAIQSKNGGLRCPECRALCAVPVKNLPANILLVRLLEGMKSAGKPILSKREVLITTGNPCAKAMYSYEPQEPGDLAFRRGDVIYLKKKVDENWYIGELNGSSGYLPATYVQVMCPLPATGTKSPPNVSNNPQSHTSTTTHSDTSSATSVAISTTTSSKVSVTALYDFEMKEEEKEDCLKFKKDDVITLIRRVDQNWAEGVIHNCIGIFPLNYVHITAAAWNLLDQPIQPQSLRTSDATVSAGKTSGRLRHTSAAATNANSTADSAAVGVSVSGGSPTRSAATADQTGGEYYNTIPTFTSNSVSIPAATQDVTASMSQQVCPPGVSRSDRVVVSSGNGSVQVTSTGSSKPTPSTPEVYQALFNYKAQKDDELNLIKGGLYAVADKCKDGWYRGHCIRTGTSGVFPGNYAAPAPKNETASTCDVLPGHRTCRVDPPSTCLQDRKPERNKQQSDNSATSSVNKMLKADRKILEEGRRFWGMDVIDTSTQQQPKMRNVARRTPSMHTTQRRRSSSLSRLDSQSTSVTQSGDQLCQPIRGRTAKRIQQLVSSKDKGSKTSRPIARLRYKCVTAYPAQSDIELDLKVGDVVTVLRKKSEGWYKGINETSGKSGVFPACFVQSLPSNQPAIPKELVQHETRNS